MLTHLERKNIVAALQSGKATYLELSRKYGVCPTRIGQIYRRETGTLSRPINKLTQREKALIVAAVQAKTASMTALAQRYGVRQSRISAVYKELTGSAWRPRKAEGNQQSLPPPLTTVLETAFRLRQENPHFQFTLEYNVKEQLISMQYNATGTRVVIIL